VVGTKACCSAVCRRPPLRCGLPQDLRRALLLLGVQAVPSSSCLPLELKLSLPLPSDMASEQAATLL